jgi:opacity protein-like surface antigen
MRRNFSLPLRLLAALLAGAAACAQVQGQVLSPDYALTAPSLLVEPELSPQGSGIAWGPVRIAAGQSMNGSGLSLEAGHQWFARAGVGRSLDTDVLSLGGGYRFNDGEALSMHVTRQLGQERLGLAVRYDWRRSYLRLSYESPVRSLGAPDLLRFSAGVRF